MCLSVNILFNTNQIFNGSLNIFYLIIVVEIKLLDSEHNLAAPLYNPNSFNSFLLFISLNTVLLKIALCLNVQ